MSETAVTIPGISPNSLESFTLSGTTVAFCLKETEMEGFQ